MSVIKYDDLPDDEVPAYELGRRNAWFRLMGWGDPHELGIDVRIESKIGEWTISVWQDGGCVGKLVVPTWVLHRLRHFRQLQASRSQQPKHTEE